MAYDLDPQLEADIIRLAKKNGIRKLILFGPRARGTSAPDSDVNLAVRGGDALRFYFDLMAQIWSILYFDVVDLDRDIPKNLQMEIERGKVVLYEETGDATSPARDIQA